MRTVKEILQVKGADIVTVSQSQTVLHALQKMTEVNIGAILITDEKGGVDGIFSERDYVRKVVENGSAALDASVQEYMTGVENTVTLSHTVDQCMALVNGQTSPAFTGDGGWEFSVVWSRLVIRLKHRLPKKSF